MNHPGPRYKRVRPEREGSIRNRLAPPPKVNGGASGENGATPKPGGPASDTLREALECGVRTAYTVIDEYLKRGYEAARSNPDHPDGRGSMRDDKTNYTNWANAWGPMAMPMQQWMAAMRAMTDAWSAFIPGGWPQQMWNMGTGGFPAAASTPALSVHVASHRPTGVTASVELNPGCENTMLTVGWLAGDGSNPPLKGVTIGRDPGSLRIYVPVAASQPAGSYHGEIRGADGRCAGKLSVVITELEGKPA